MLPSDIRELILSIPLPVAYTPNDTPCWPSKNGECTTKNAYDLLISSLHPDKTIYSFDLLIEFNLEAIYSPVSSDVFGAGRLSLDKLPTKSNLYWLQDKSCPVCKIQKETVHHIFQTCRFTKLVWKRLNIYSAS